MVRAPLKPPLSRNLKDWPARSNRALRRLILVGGMTRPLSRVPIVLRSSLLERFRGGCSFGAETMLGLFHKTAMTIENMERRVITVNPAKVDLRGSPGSP